MNRKKPFLKNMAKSLPNLRIFDNSFYQERAFLKLVDIPYTKQDHRRIKSTIENPSFFYHFVQITKAPLVKIAYEIIEADRICNAAQKEELFAQEMVDLTDTHIVISASDDMLKELNENCQKIAQERKIRFPQIEKFSYQFMIAKHHPTCDSFKVEKKPNLRVV